ncbi:MAG: tetratricopeptide repeat protein [Bdellovibrionales bacterium]|nr:tetratricopeptide repeat protein [Bdellovibrionales bacterium]
MRERESRVVLGILCLAVSLCFTGCSAQKQMQQKIDRIERGLEDSRKVQAELIARLDSLENQARSVTGKVEELQYSQNYQIGGDVDSLKQDLSRLQRRIPPPALVPLLALEEDEAAVEAFPPEAARLFANELTRMRTGNYRDALPGLRSLADSLAPDDLRARARFWAGIAEEGVGNNADALRAYHSLAQTFPTHPRIPLALLRQSSVFVRLKDLNTAKLTLQKLIAQFPNTPEATDAKEKLKRLR